MSDRAAEKDHLIEVYSLNLHIQGTVAGGFQLKRKLEMN